MRKANISKGNIIPMCLFIISCVGVLFYFHISTTFDEKYTLLLIRNNFSRLIDLDSLDVHPPFYYLILKYFLIITTFWTKSLFVKVIFARILSLIFAIIGFVYVYKLLGLFKFKLHWIYQWLIFISIPNILSSINPYSTDPIVNIRMYSLSAMIIIAEFYYLIEFNYDNTHQYKNVIIITILTTLALYTHYFSAIISCIMAIVFIVKYVFTRNKNKSIKLIVSLIISLILYLPWIPFFFKQLSIPVSQTAHLSLFSAIARIILFVFLYLLFIYPNFWAYKNLGKRFNSVLLELNVVIIATVLFMTIFSMIIRPMFSYRYMYPIFWIYEVISLDILFGYMIKKQSVFKRIYLLFWLLLLIFNFVGSSYYQLMKIDIPSANVHENISRIAHSNKHLIKLNAKNSRIQESPNLKPNNKNLKYNIDNTPINFEYAYYLSNYNKYIKAKGLSNYFDIRTHPSYKPLFKSVYSHIYK